MSGLMNSAVSVLMRSNRIYIPLILIGGFAGEQIVDSAFNRMWESNNQGKLYKQLEGTVIGKPKEEE
jgi:hypothetical protein|eukprot:CAMPEP_0198206484 /NCGR_PEP_ID=MMETSP1445-20131203/10029_1 /TAXON_ID=36898 /ORGANISM="Pyramimonas sp., Strain CCMP2087" /LENGTH=66 /DNA_ID=CAMNT_0043879197 /DNA_START=90 /DNA_END=290 /DNA_ORIENTATION=-